MIERDIKITGSQIHETCQIIHPVNIYGAKLEKNVFIGPFVEIQSGAEVGSRTKIQSHSFICSMVKLGSDCFIGHGVMFINDTFASGEPANGEKTKWRSTDVSNHVYIGSNATILPVSICSNVVIGAGAVVTKDIKEPGTYAGNPARKIK
jgi:acetyltransferase-like isoleucine patch superfamily enzyme